MRQDWIVDSRDGVTGRDSGYPGTSGWGWGSGGISPASWRRTVEEVDRVPGTRSREHSGVASSLGSMESQLIQEMIRCQQDFFMEATEIGRATGTSLSAADGTRCRLCRARARFLTRILFHFLLRPFSPDFQP